ncbi:putative signal transducing protein [Granulicella tundricola]|uniref:Uncharacterized protein n=1 Tax=Granulicella tundricola (strain ATCC BAA-1859 / DSM 23138 / MP5ACTX9) TaxID=1198114 RepID=E8X5L8_GRATM|nr:DUF2007 domain-containing protein [Granulicella tundricola]ADW70645.1 hypothetical protein AciX9_3642 [Granulicella tundricola MP5ACTX9]
MLPDPGELAAHYATLNEPDLLDLARTYDSLTEAAQASLRAEFARRGLEPPLIQDELIPTKLVVVERYRDLSEAIVARSYLESAGIQVYLYDENLVRLDWQVSNFIGGIRLKVEASDEAEARELLAQPVPESIEFADGEEFDQPHCPVCSSTDITFQGSSRGPAIAALFIASVPLPPGKKSWICNHCNAHWEDTEDSEATN